LGWEQLFLELSQKHFKYPWRRFEAVQNVHPPQIVGGLHFLTVSRLQFSGFCKAQLVFEA
jgi:hypothetical protein